MKRILETYGDFEISWNNATWEITVSALGQEPLVFDLSEEKGGNETAVPRRFLVKVLPWRYLSDPDGDIGLGNYDLNHDGIKCACDALMSIGYTHCVATEVMEGLLYGKAQEMLQTFNAKKTGGK